MYICRALWIVFGTAYAVLSNLYGQIHFDNILPEAGLSQSTVGCLLQDRYGFVWIGTQDGLNRYDGYRFLIYKSRKGDSASLADNSINALLEDAGGRLWIGTS
ncbi:MAG: hypothetical protein KDC45_15365, partial [Bacteroidetes bacterium]|nr:hypothetical protein [Bacteroidota bacterium]